MRIVLAPDSYKGSLSASQVAFYMEEAIREVAPWIRVEKVPIADGGEGTVDAFLAGAGGEKRNLTVTGPLGEPVQAFFGILPDGTGVIEMAAASGLPLVPPERRNPLITTTYGTGELIKGALDAGCRRLVIGVGGSATNDGGLGMAQALGGLFLDGSGRPLAFGGGELSKLERIDLQGLDPRLRGMEILVACDVDNPLWGPNGAAAVFAPQKGADPEMVCRLDEGLKHLADVMRRELGRDVGDLPGAGAAGGLGAALLAFLGASLQPGIEVMAAVTGLEEKIAGADLVITGEGNTDYQTARGKAPVGVGRIARKYGVPVIALSGGLGLDVERVYEAGLDAVFSIMPGPLTLEEAMERAPELLKKATANLIRLLLKWQEREAR
ncbi:MAG: glycerate kinase [Clostridia bacterium]|jgi:glycerate kinase|nr:glycerate kinase [Clostridia bacterium]